jgi:uncharacterized protein
MLYWAGIAPDQIIWRIIRAIRHPRNYLERPDPIWYRLVKIQLEAGGKNDHLIRAYTPGSVTINADTYEASLVVSRSSLISDWGPGTIHELTTEHVDKILALEPELILIGTGDILTFPPTEKLRAIIDAGIGYEIMDTGAACRTYNVLMAEGREIVAGLII